MMEWIPVLFVTFKALVLGTGMFFAIKWHYDQGRKLKDRRAVLFAGGKVAALFLLGLLVVGLIAYSMVTMLHLNLNN